MKIYIIQEKKSGYMIDIFNTIAEATAELKKYEDEDEEMEIYSENFYEIIETKHKQNENN
jgi:hypothetical protein